MAVRLDDEEGLNLTRATLAATLKYPWLYGEGGPNSTKKWSAYRSEREDFSFAREGLVEGFKSAEAELMDWSDDIAYSVHDLEDFHRAGMIPWNFLLNDRDEEAKLVQGAVQGWWDRPSDTEAKDRIENAFRRIKVFIPWEIREPYSGTRAQRQKVRVWTSLLVGRYFGALWLRKPTSNDSRTVEIKQDLEDEVRILKQLTRHYVIDNPALAAQQHGQRRVLSELFDTFIDALNKKANQRIIPARFEHLIESSTSAEDKARLAADCIASMTEDEALALHRRLMGTAAGSVLNPIFR